MSNLLAATSFGDLTGMGFDGQCAQSDGLLHMLSVPVAAVAPQQFWESGVPEHERRRRLDDDEVLLILKTVWGLLQ